MLTFDYDGAHAIIASRRKCPACLSYYEKKVGGLSKPGKMPWYAWSIPATDCKVGSALRDIENSVCSKCYAMKGRYAFGNVRKALERRHAQYRHNPATWAAHMVLLLEGKARGEEHYFRWFDSGDVQGYEMLQAIVWIAQQLPHINFWLPTKETALFRRDSVKALVATAPNLTVRISAPMLRQLNEAPGYVTSSVGCEPNDRSYQCPASTQDGKCGDCRACWSPMTVNVNYPQQEGVHVILVAGDHRGGDVRGDCRSDLGGMVWEQVGAVTRFTGCKIEGVCSMKSTPGAQPRGRSSRK